MVRGTQVSGSDGNPMVTLYQFGRGPNSPSLTPFAIKLETYLRVADIPYKNDHSGKASSKGKFPWISYNGKEIADSEFGVEFLNKERNIDLNSHLSAEQRGAGRALQKMVEENTYWVLVLDRWVYDKTNGAPNALGVPSILRWLFRSRVKTATQKQGMGRHSKAEVEQILRTDLQAVSDYIGTKKFLFGDKVSQYDCAVFGQTAALFYEPFSGIAGSVTADFPVVRGYCDRMKAEFWPDWEECTTGGGTRQATKYGDGGNPMVTLHQVGRAPNTPSITPFAVKLETYLRVAKIPYKNEHGRKSSFKGKIPWISYNGKEIADSEFSIEFLNKERNIDLTSHLSAEQRGAGRALQKMVEENTYWTLVLDRWVYDKTNGDPTALGLPAMVRWFFRSKVKTQAKNQGMGRHTQEEVEQIMRSDLGAISDYIGTKRFLFGDQVSQYDCAVFGLMTVVFYEPFGGITGKVAADFPVVRGYCDRMKAEFWPDWEQCTTGGGTREATK